MSATGKEGVGKEGEGEYWAERTEYFEPDVKAGIEEGGDAEEGAVSAFVDGLLRAGVDSCEGVEDGKSVSSGNRDGTYPRCRISRGPRALCSCDIGPSGARASCFGFGDWWRR